MPSIVSLPSRVVFQTISIARLVPAMLMVSAINCSQPKAEPAPKAPQCGRAEAPLRGEPLATQPRYTGADADRPRIPIRMSMVASGFEAITDIQFPPALEPIMVVVTQGGTAWWVSLTDDTRGELLRVTDLVSGGEQGLLGIAFDPLFCENGRFFINYTARGGTDGISRIVAWQLAKADFRKGKAVRLHTVMEVDQPYANHNAGQLAFGPDGYLYVGFGDGGSANDPHGNGQNPKALLGKMLRLDVGNETDSQTPYEIPAGNPFVGDAAYRPEIWALGLRNPWRYSFDPSGRLVVADVGQNQWEEIDLVEKGKNYGWNQREGRHCSAVAPDCTTAGFTDPVYEYSHDEGFSITGGYVYTGVRASKLAGKYIFGDYFGRLWALDLPESGSAQAANVHTLGEWPMLFSTFGRDSAGEVYVADHGKGVVYRIDPSAP